MTQPIQAFRPIDQGTVSLATTSSTARVALAVTKASSYLVTNEGTTTAFIRFGDSAITATLPAGATGGSMPVAAGTVQVFRIGPSTVTHVAALTSTGTGTLYVTPGEGY